MCKNTHMCHTKHLWGVTQDWFELSRQFYLGKVGETGYYLGVLGLEGFIINSSLGVEGILDSADSSFRVLFF